MLTASVDTPAGTTGNDTFSGKVDFSSASATTYNSFDVITGGAGVDTLNLTLENAVTASSATTAVAQKVNYTFGFTDVTSALGAGVTINITVGSTTYTVTTDTTPTKNEVTDLVASVLSSALAGVATVVKGKIVSSAFVAPSSEASDDTTIQITAATAGNALPAIVISDSGAAYAATATVVNANRVAVDAVLASSAAAADVIGVENVIIKNTDADAVTVSAAGWKDVQSVAFDKLQGAVTVTNSKLVAAGLTGTSAGATITVTDAATAGTADAASLTFDTVTSTATTALAYDSATAGRIESINYTLTGTNKVDGMAQGNKTTTISGAGTLATNTASTLVLGAAGYVLDGSASTGALKFIADNGAMNTAAAAATGTPAAQILTGSGADDVILQDVLASSDNLSINLGAGNDKLTLKTGSNDFTSTKVTISGGEGEDTLSLDGADAKAIYGSTTKTVISGFEKLLITNLESATDASKWANYTFTIDGADSGGTLVNIANGSTVTLSTDLAQNISLVVKDAGAAGRISDSLTINISDVSDSSVKTVTVADVETINLVSTEATAATGDANKVLLSATSASTLNISGAEALTLGNTSSGFAGLRVLDAGSMTGKLTADLISAGAGVAVTVGSGGSDLFLSAYADTLALGSGADKVTIEFNTTSSSEATNSSVSAADAITGFDITKDSIVAVDLNSSAVTVAINDDILSGSTTNGTVTTLIKDGVVTGFTKGNGSSAVALTVGTSSEVDTVAEVVALLSGASVVSGSAAKGSSAVFQYGSDSYLFVQNTVSGTTDDVVVKLVGVTGVDKLTVSSGAFTLADLVA